MVWIEIEVIQEVTMGENKSGLHWPILYGLVFSIKLTVVYVMEGGPDDNKDGLEYLQKLKKLLNIWKTHLAVLLQALLLRDQRCQASIVEHG